MSSGIATLSSRIHDWCKETDISQQQLLTGDNPAAAEPCLQAAAQTAGAGPDGQQQQDMECIKSAFSPVAVLGIRSLPDALHPGYRMELLQQLQAEQQRQHSNSQASSSGQHLSRGAHDTDSSTRQLRSGGGKNTSGRAPQRYGPLEGYFSCYPNMTSEYERRDVMDKFARLHSKLAQVGLEDFVVRGCAPPCPHSPTFATYQHDLPPFEEVDHLGRPMHHQPQPQLQPFLPSGRNSSPNMLLRGQVADLLSGLDASLSKDWPHSFIKAFIDHKGCVVLSFDRDAAAVEGDLTTYLNHQEKHGSIMEEFRLVKDPRRWGVLEGDGASVFYILIPPWCNSRAVLQQL